MNEILQCPSYSSTLYCVCLQAWDDVVRKKKPKEKPFNYKVLQPLNEEKSQLSLAEVYEQEYIKQTQVNIVTL